MLPVGPTTAAPSRVTATVPSRPEQAVPYELLTQVKAFALEKLHTMLRAQARNAIFFMGSSLRVEALRQLSFLGSTNGFICSESFGWRS